MTAHSPAWDAYRAACDDHRRKVILHRQYRRATRADVDAAKERRDAAYKALVAEQREGR